MAQHGRIDRRIPVLAWVLVAGAAVQVAIWAAANWYRVFGPYLILRLEDASAIVTGVTPFLLAAAVLVGAARWPAGRPWLYAGAAFAAVHGVMRTAADAWWAWRVTDPVAPDGPLQIALVVANLTAVTAAALAPLCLAVGLRRVEPARRAPPRAAVIIVVVGLAAAAASLGLAAREIAFASEHPPGDTALIALWVAHRALTTLGGLAFAVLALAALRAFPPAGIVPEVLIAAGGTLTAAALAANWAGQSLLSFEAQSTHLLWVFTAPWTVESLGKVLIIAGFAVAALQLARTAPPSSARRQAPAETLSG